MSLQERELDQSDRLLPRLDTGCAILAILSARPCPEAVIDDREPGHHGGKRDGYGRPRAVTVEPAIGIEVAGDALVQERIRQSGGHGCSRGRST